MAEPDFMNGTHTSQIIWQRVQEVAGAANRRVEVALFAGEVVFATGERGAYIGVEVVGVGNDPGAFSGNAMVLLDDGSVSRQTFEGQTVSSNGHDRISGIGTWNMESGTGRFAGRHGGGQFKWSQVGNSYQDEFTE